MVYIHVYSLRNIVFSATLLALFRFQHQAGSRPRNFQSFWPTFQAQDAAIIRLLGKDACLSPTRGGRSPIAARIMVKNGPITLAHS